MLPRIKPILALRNVVETQDYNLVLHNDYNNHSGITCKVSVTLLL